MRGYVHRRGQMKQVLDLLTKLLSMCESSTVLIETDADGNGMTLSEYRVASQRGFDARRTSSSE